MSDKTFNFLFQTIWTIAISLVIFDFFFILQTEHLKSTRRYEIENNCKWDHHSEMCFTQEQRPWMFE